MQKGAILRKCANTFVPHCSSAFSGVVCFGGSLLCSLEMESLSAGYLVLFPVIECFFFGQLKLTVQPCKICFG